MGSTAIRSRRPQPSVFNMILGFKASIVLALFDYSTGRFWRMRKSFFANCLCVLGFTNPPISKALAPDAFHYLLGALTV